jgi:hypothetical protein
MATWLVWTPFPVVDYGLFLASFQGGERENELFWILF